MIRRICTKCKIEKEVKFFSEATGRIIRRCKACITKYRTTRNALSSVKNKAIVYREESKATNPFRYLFLKKRVDSKCRGLDFNLTEDYLKSLWTGFCPVFNIPLIPLSTKIPRNRPIDSAQLDRIDSTKGYVMGNVRFLSARANRLKDNGTLEEFEQIVKFLKEAKNE